MYADRESCRDRCGPRCGYWGPANLALIRVARAGNQLRIGLELNRPGVDERIGGNRALWRPRIRTVERVINSRVGDGAQLEFSAGGNLAGSAAEGRRLSELVIDELEPLGQPAFHPIDFALVRSASGFEPPAPNLSRLSGAHLIGETVHQLKQICFGEIISPQVLPAIHPKLPEVRIVEQAVPPGSGKEPSRVPTAWIGIAIVNRAQGAVKIPVGAKS